MLVIFSTLLNTYTGKDSRLETKDSKYFGISRSFQFNLDNIISPLVPAIVSNLV